MEKEDKVADALIEIAKDIGNYFKTKEQAEKRLEHILIEQQLKDIALRLNKGEKVRVDVNVKVNKEQINKELEEKFRDVNPEKVSAGKLNAIARMIVKRNIEITLTNNGKEIKPRDLKEC